MTETKLPKFNRTFLNVQRDDNGKVIAFEIDRRYWGTGANGGSLLDLYTEKMCCLGFYSLACNIPYKEINNEDLPSHLPRVPKQMEWLGEPSTLPADVQTDYENALAGINDDTELKNSDRERKIKARFAKNGITVTFVN